MRDEFVLDASAVLSILLEEAGHERVTQIVDRSRIHAVNLAEVMGRLVRAGMPGNKAAAVLRGLYLEVDEEFGIAQAERCGILLGTRRDLGLSLGDCLCLTVAAFLGAVAVTADRRWKELHGVRLGSRTIRVEVIR
ncbi:MAG TPA: type II toxin-antitoxin system VapC family toxin [Bryobacteraceae bacterium]|nr:type II toxin-antitoxin system VapC family toxin [Bryobacteraceae bacterium]